MGSIKRIPIRIRSVLSRSRQNPLPVHVKEKLLYHCSACGNKYYKHHIFCPECLCEVRPNHKITSSLTIRALNRNKKEPVAHLLKTLTGSTYDFNKALQSLPWTFITNSDMPVVECWKEILEAEKITVSIETVPVKPRRWKKPFFQSDAPFPRFFPASLESGIRAVAKSLQNASIRILWVEVVMKAVDILDDFYKHNPQHRILFSDFLFHIEQGLQASIACYNGYPKNREDFFLAHVTKFKKELDQMQSEIEAVKRQVEEQL